MTALVLQTLAAGGRRGNVLADVICRLVTEGAELGALVDRAVLGPDGAPHVTRVMPPEWLQRLHTAIERGVFDDPTKDTVRRVVDRILAPPLPAET